MTARPLSLAGAAMFALAAFLTFAAAGETVPVLSDLRPPPEEAPQEVDDKPATPATVNPANRISDPARLVPAGPAIHLYVPDSARFGADFAANTLGRLSQEPPVTRMLANNRFGLTSLFSDLPSAVISPDRIKAVDGMFGLAQVLSRDSLGGTVSAYTGLDGDMSFLALIDVGLDRLEAFNTMTEWETSYIVDNPRVEVVRGDHKGNFLDIWTVGGRDSGAKPAQVAAGFAENLAVISNDAQLANAAMALLKGGASLADSPWGRRLAASRPEKADMFGFVRMDSLLDSMADNPAARMAVMGWAGLLGYGGAEGEALYFGMQFMPDGSRETWLLPPSGSARNPSLVELLARRLKTTTHWTSPSVIPYQPPPVFFASAMLDGRQLGNLLKLQRGLFNGQEDEIARTISDTADRVLNPQVSGLLTGEIGIALFSPVDEKSPANWLMVLPCTANAESGMSGITKTADRGGAVVYSSNSDWRNNVSWTAVGPARFQRLASNFIIVGSTGAAVSSCLDQIIAGVSFLDNKDFRRAMTEAEADQGLVFYLNLPEMLIREYPQLSSRMRQVYPRSSGLNNRPPLTLLRRYAKGLMGVVAPAGPDGEFVRVTVQSPAPLLGMAAASTVLTYPQSLRLLGRLAMAKSRDNLQALWLRLQLYSSRHGTFPDSVEDFTGDLRRTMSQDEIRSLFIAPAALMRMPAAEAAEKSYHFLSGLYPNDEPDLPLIYESQPWTEDFTGMYPSDRNQAPTESGDFVPYRQFIQLDGKVVVTPEKTFQDKVASRLAERE